MKTNLTLALLATLLPVLAHANEAIEAQKWTFEGPKGTWDKAELYRGYTVATQVCMACHSFKYVSHRDLMRAGFTEKEVTTLAKGMNMTLDAKLISAQDPESAKSTFGKVPPDLSLMAKARHGGADYIYAVLNGYIEDPETIHELLPNGVPEGANFNMAFPGNAIAMPAPLTGPDMVTYTDGTSATVPQMAHDVATFIAWAGEPEKVERQHLGVYVLLYILVFAVLAYLAKRVIWKDVKGH